MGPGRQSKGRAHLQNEQKRQQCAENVLPGFHRFVNSLKIVGFLKDFRIRKKFQSLCQLLIPEDAEKGNT
jgi:hypothetical protein